MKITILGIDVAQNVLQLYGVDAQGNVVVRKQRARSKLLPFGPVDPLSYWYGSVPGGASGSPHHAEAGP